MKIPASTALALAVVFSMLAASAHGAPTQWTAGSGGNGHWYDVVTVPNGISWTDAKAAAEASGGYLATITSSAENTFVFNLANANPSAWDMAVGSNTLGPWLGGFQTDNLAEPAGHWAWVTGESWSYTNWAPGEPNNGLAGPKEDFLVLYGAGTTRNSFWNDCKVTGEPSVPYLIFGYVAEFNTQPVPEPATLAMLSVGVLAMLRRSRHARSQP